MTDERAGFFSFQVESEGSPELPSSMEVVEIELDPKTETESHTETTVEELDPDTPEVDLSIVDLRTDRDALARGLLDAEGRAAELRARVAELEAGLLRALTWIADITEDAYCPVCYLDVQHNDAGELQHEDDCPHAALIKLVGGEG